MAIDSLELIVPQNAARPILDCYRAKSFAQELAEYDFELSLDIDKDQIKK